MTNAPRSGPSISLEDRKGLLQALQIEGYDRVIREKEKVLNKYFTKSKTRKEVEKILRFYTLSAKDYNPYRLGCEEERSEYPGMSSHALSKWHHVLPDQEPGVASAIADALEEMSQPHHGFSMTEMMVLSFLSCLTGSGKGHEMLDSSATLLLFRLMMDLEEEAIALQDNFHSLFVHVSQSFWKLLEQKELQATVAVTSDSKKDTTIPADTTDEKDKLAASLDPFQLSVRWKLIERFDQIVAESIRLNDELSVSNA